MVCQQVQMAISQKYWLLVENHQFDSQISEILGAFRERLQLLFTIKK